MSNLPGRRVVFFTNPQPRGGTNGAFAGRSSHDTMQIAQGGQSSS